MKLDSDLFQLYTPQLAKLTEQWLQVEVGPWLDKVRQRIGFTAFALVKYDGMAGPHNRVIGTQMARTPPFSELPNTLQDYLVRQVPNLKARAIYYCMNIAIDPEYQGLGLSEVLWCSSNEYVDQTYPLNGAVMLCQIRSDNQPSENSARAVGFRPTGVRGVSSRPQPPFEDWQYWCRVSESIITRA